jgi:hypothetical protein
MQTHQKPLYGTKTIPVLNVGIVLGLYGGWNAVV